MTDMNSFVAIVSTLSNGILKIPVLILPILICIYVWPKRRERGFFWLIFSMISFAVGEGACGVNAWILMDFVPPFEMLHGLGMAIGFGTIGIALYYIAEDHFLYFSDEEKPCLLLRFCKSGCPKSKHTTNRSRKKCNMKTLIMYSCFFLTFLCLMPMSVLPLASTEFMNPEKYSTITVPVLSPLYTDHLLPMFPFFTYDLWHKYDPHRYPVIHLFERYLYPALAMICLVTAGFILLIKKRQPERLAIYFLSFGLGCLGP